MAEAPTDRDDLNERLARVERLVKASESEWFTAEQFAERLRTTRRTILRWVAEKRIPEPKKFGKLARWSREVVEKVEAEGIGRPLDQGDELNRLTPGGVTIKCPCCGEEIRVKRDGTAEAVNPKPSKDAEKGAGPSVGRVPKSAGRKPRKV